MAQTGKSRPVDRSTAEIAKTLSSIRDRHLKTPRDAEFTMHLDRLLQRDDDGNLLPCPLKFTRTGETRGVMVVDGAGGGKSTLVSHVLKNHPVLGDSSSCGPRYISAIAPSPATFKNMGKELSKESGYPITTDRRDAWSIWNMLSGRLHDTGKAVLWIDEAHDLFSKDRELILRALKYLMQGDQAIVVVLSGTEKLLEIVRSDPQVQRRFSAMVLPPVSAASEGRIFARIIRDYCVMADLDPPENADLVPRLVHAARYRLGRSIELITDAIEQALTDGCPHLLIDHFAAAFTLHEAAEIGDNIFLSPRWQEIDPDRRDDPNAQMRGRRRGRG